MSETLTLTEVAQILKIDSVTLRKMASNGEIQSFKISNRKKSEYRFTEGDIAEYIERNRVVKKGARV